jgi:hypothetical protein
LSVLPTGDLGELYFYESVSYLITEFIGDPTIFPPNALPELPLFKSPKSNDPFLIKFDIADESVFANY